MALLAGPVDYTDCISAEGYTPRNECLVYEAKQSDGEAPVMLELRGIWSTHLLSLLSGPFLPGVVAPKHLYLCKTELTFKLRTYA